MELDANMIIRALQNQRESALNECAVLAAKNMALEKELKELKEGKSDNVVPIKHD